MAIIHFIDLETTGFYFKNNDRILQFAVVKYDPYEDKIISEVEFTVNPNRFIGEDTIKIHGITNEIAKKQKPISEHIFILEESMKEGSYICGHNISRFDIPFIFQELIRANKKIPKNFYLIDTYLLAKKFIPNLTSYSLDALCDHYSICKKSRINNHGAKIDSKLTVELFKKLKENYNLLNDLIFVDDDYILSKKLNYEINSNNTLSPQYLNLSSDENKKIQDWLKNEKFYLPSKKQVDPQLVVDDNDSSYFPLVTLANKYPYLSKKIFVDYLIKLNLINGKNLEPIESGNNNLIKYKKSKNYNIFYACFNSEIIKSIFSDKNILKQLKIDSISYIKKEL